ncbi:UDP-galactopyranose mutase [Alicyclobacillus sp. SO9]|uniref:UDP-galactopyranose mutase n=1 Tax=Alicyclobacillus sp. SO9 TaxID=2665646 RepID=UPI0018E85CDA|nr:UDP-galactopyranose mutase [Alicyclobacillus sp. SO9]QQE78732.1 UDP-galactopyranose mutase [Alicyclobacillus sp. SO9]
MQFDYVVIGAGFAGATIAERIATVLKKKVLVIEQRSHIGGNAYDTVDENGILIHRYGPHIFHTKLPHVWEYLSEFTDWTTYHHRVLGVIDGKTVPIPFNYESLHQTFPPALAKRIEEKLTHQFQYNSKIPILRLLEESDADLQFLADYIYNKVFLNYTVKQWGVRPEEIDPTVTSRVPIYLSRDDRYFQDKYQAMPKKGYTKMFESMLFRENISLLLNTDYKEVLRADLETGDLFVFGQPFQGTVIYTGPIDSFFNYQFGELPYRSLNFEFEHYETEFYQSTGTVNYPNDYDFTRITEFKHLTAQTSSSTTIVREYPQSYVPGVNIPYYPVKNDENHALYRKYMQRAKDLRKVIFLGRLAEYQYYDMDAVVSKALKVFAEKINS